MSRRSQWIRYLLLAALSSAALLAGGVIIVSLLPVPTPPPPKGPAAEVYHFPGEDGWELAAHRFRPCTGAPCEKGARVPESAPPVLLCHGLAMNRWTFDLREDRSLARTLSAAGFDVWMVELRGHGLSKPPLDREPRPWGLAEYINEDLPTLVGGVQEVTGAETVHWLGHSMGGVVLWGYLATHPDNPLASGIAVGSPGRLDGRPGLDGMYLSQTSLANFIPTLPIDVGARFFARLTGRPMGIELSWDVNNMQPEIVQETMAHALAPIQPGELVGFQPMVESGTFMSPDGKVNYEAGYPAITTPLLFLTTAGDRMGTPASLRHVFEKVGSKIKEFIVISKASGAHVNYGHIDQLMGDHAAQDVYPTITSWLVARSLETDKAPESPQPPAASDPL